MQDHSKDSGEDARARSKGQQSPDRDADQLIDLAEAIIPSRALHLVAEAGIADLLGETPRSVDDLAAETSTNSQVLYSILRLLAGYGIFAETSARQFTLTPRGELLRSGDPRSLRSYLREFAFIGRVVLGADHSLYHGEPSFDNVFGQSFFDYLRTHPDEGRMFDAAMADLSRAEIRAILSEYDFSGYERIVDVGGGDGTLLAAILTAYPKATGVLFDQPQVTDRARQAHDNSGLGGRLEIVAGDFFDMVPDGGDLYVLKKLIHDWPDPRAADILRRCRQAISPRGKLVLFERMIGAENNAIQAMTFDLLMFLLLGGRERTQPEFEALFAASGFRLDRIKQISPAIFAIDAVPAEAG